MPESQPEPVEKCSSADELAIALIATAIQDIRRDRHKHACLSLMDAINNLRGDILGRARDCLFSAWLRRVVARYLLEVWPPVVDNENTSHSKRLATDDTQFLNGRDVGLREALCGIHGAGQ